VPPLGGATSVDPVEPGLPPRATPGEPGRGGTP
jgi:hypothetical protein